jgi:hypothetical protein
MKRYLHAILLFDCLLPALFLGLPCCALLWAVMRFQSLAIEKADAQASYETQSHQVATLSDELQPMQAKVALLKGILSSDDIEAKLGSGIAAALEKFSSDDIEQTLHDFQFGPSTIGPNFGDGRRLTLKVLSRWEALNTATADWETRFPNMVLESLSIDMVPGSATSRPYLQSGLTYFIMTEN